MAVVVSLCECDTTMTLIYIQNICIQSNPGATPVQGLLHQIRRVSLHDVSNPDLRQASFRRDSVELEKSGLGPGG